MDSYEGQSQDPESLHKYLYVSSDPINRVDPSGFLSRFEYAAIGRIVHAEISLHFVSSDRVNRYANYVSIQQILEDFDIDAPGEAIRPDLVDMLSKEVYEIKPDRDGRGSDKATNQLKKYIDTFLDYGVGLKPGVSYYPPQVIPLPPLYSSIEAHARLALPGVILYDLVQKQDNKRISDVAAVAAAAYLFQVVSRAVAAQNAGVAEETVLAFQVETI